MGVINGFYYGTQGDGSYAQCCHCYNNAVPLSSYKYVNRFKCGASCYNTGFITCPPGYIAGETVVPYYTTVDVNLSASGATTSIDSYIDIYGGEVVETETCNGSYSFSGSINFSQDANGLCSNTCNLSGSASNSTADTYSGPSNIQRFSTSSSCSGTANGCSNVYYDGYDSTWEGIAPTGTTTVTNSSYYGSTTYTTNGGVGCNVCGGNVTNDYTGTEEYTTDQLVADTMAAYNALPWPALATGFYVNAETVVTRNESACIVAGVQYCYAVPIDPILTPTGCFTLTWEELYIPPDGSANQVLATRSFNWTQGAKYPGFDSNDVTTWPRSPVYTINPPAYPGSSGSSYGYITIRPITSNCNCTQTSS